jgi:uncharacterized protein (TIGR02145 family)
MKKNILIALQVLSCFVLQAQTGIGTPSPDPSAVLELKSNTRGFLPPRLTTAQRNSILAPAIGLVVYNSDKNCLEWFNGTTWYNGCGNQDSSGGTALVSGYTTTGIPTGTLTVGSPATGVTQTITAMVEKLGFYNISTTVNGVTFSASGIFTATGAQNIVLTATGTPTAIETSTFVSNTTPSVSFNRETKPKSVTSNGSAVVSGYTNTGISIGTLTVDTDLTGVTQTITADVTTPGTYDISTTSNGITFSAKGIFTGTGAQDIVLTASGKPLAIETSNFVLNTTPSTNFSRDTNPKSLTSNGSAIVSVYSDANISEGRLTVGVPVTGVTHTIVANVTTPGTYDISTTSNGVTFTGSGTFTSTGAQNIVLTASGTPTVVETSNFVLNTTPNTNFNRNTIPKSVTSNGSAVVSTYTDAGIFTGTLTVGTPASGVTHTITANVTTPGTYEISTTSNGVTFTGSGTFTGTGAQNIVLTATGTPIAAQTSNFVLNTTPNTSFNRDTNAKSATSNGSAVISGYSDTGIPTGTLTVGKAVTGVTHTITANVTTPGSYEISTTSNGVTFSGQGTISGTGQHEIVLTATGTPLASETSTFVLNTTPSVSFNRDTNNTTSGGTAIVSGYSNANISSGVLITGKAASGVTQTITANVDAAGSYNISTVSNGVTFSGSGTFTGIGDQDIILNASGTPLLSETSTFVLNTIPNTSFSRDVNPKSDSSNGTAVVSGYTDDSISTGILRVGTTVTGVTHIIIANVKTVGSYDISTSANGVTFSGSGIFTGTGAQNILLTATGSPVVSETSNFTLNTDPSCSFSRQVLAPLPGPVAGKAICDGSAPTVVVPVISKTGRIWMDRNLGASRAGTAVDDYQAYGCLYQWGRGNDGHASINWVYYNSGTPLNDITYTLANTILPGNPLFIVSRDGDWRYHPIIALWQGVTGYNNPCPSGYRVPTDAEFMAEKNAYSITNSLTAYSSPFKLVNAGYRDSQFGNISSTGSLGQYWTSSSPSAIGSNFHIFTSSVTNSVLKNHATGASVRCIKD